MKLLRPGSLRWRLTSRVIAAQLALLVLLGVVQLLVEAFLWYRGHLYYGTNSYAAVNAVADSISRDAGGQLRVDPSPELRRRLDQDPVFWFVVRDREGQQVMHGAPPEAIAPAIIGMDSVAYADLGQDIGKSQAPLGTVQWAMSPAGEIKVMTTARTPVTLGQALWVVSVKNLVAVVFLTFIIVVVMLVITPWVVKRTLAGMHRAAAGAREIDFNQRGMRLDSRDVPVEILPFVDAVNGAFNRLDEGYDSHRRFLADAAHELRTPIAILNTRLASLPSGVIKTRLLADAARLTALGNQLLDLQQLEQNNVSFQTVDLVSLAEGVVGDIAPLAVGAGYDVSLEADMAQAWVTANPLAIERALINLLQNAINYGGQTGGISVKIGEQGTVDVIDEGFGVPEDERERIFEPFHRLKNDGRGSGLGLDLVQKIMAQHGGYAELLETRSCGAHFRLNFKDVKVLYRKPAEEVPLGVKNTDYSSR